MVLLLCFASECTYRTPFYQYISKREKKKQKKRKKKASLTGGARRFVKVFDILFDALKRRNMIIKKNGKTHRA